jgi:hypothetical protein
MSNVKKQSIHSKSSAKISEDSETSVDINKLINWRPRQIKEKPSKIFNDFPKNYFQIINFTMLDKEIVAPLAKYSLNFYKSTERLSLIQKTNNTSKLFGKFPSIS